MCVDLDSKNSFLGQNFSNFDLVIQSFMKTYFRYDTTLDQE